MPKRLLTKEKSCKGPWLRNKQRGWDKLWPTQSAWMGLWCACENKEICGGLLRILCQRCLSSMLAGIVLKFPTLKPFTLASVSTTTSTLMICTPQKTPLAMLLPSGTLSAPWYVLLELITSRLSELKTPNLVKWLLSGNFTTTSNQFRSLTSGKTSSKDSLSTKYNQLY